MPGSRGSDPSDGVHVDERLRLRHYETLLAIAGGGAGGSAADGTTLEELTRGFGFRVKSNASRWVKQLRRLRLVEVTRDARDPRLKRIRLTPEGATMIRGAAG